MPVVSPGYTSAGSPHPRTSPVRVLRFGSPGYTSADSPTPEHLRLVPPSRLHHSSPPLLTFLFCSEMQSQPVNCHCSAISGSVSKHLNVAEVNHLTECLVLLQIKSTSIRWASSTPGSHPLLPSAAGRSSSNWVTCRELNQGWWNPLH